MLTSVVRQAKTVNDPSFSIAQNLTAQHRNVTLNNQHAPRARNPNTVYHASTTDRPAELQIYGLKRTPARWLDYLRATLTGMLLLLTTNTGFHGGETKLGRWPVLPYQA